MEESIKNRIILILVVLTIIFFIATINSCSNVNKFRVIRDKEIVLRLELEEKLSNFAQEKTNMEEKLKNLEQGLQQEKSNHEATKKALAQEQLVTGSLKEELERTIKLKETLEKNLKEALSKK